MHNSVKLLGIHAIMIIISASWWPSHHLFKRLRNNHYSLLITVLAIVSCTIAMALLVIVGYALGQHIQDPLVRSMGAKAAGEPSSLNFFWFPFALLGLGIFAGFLSGYMQLKIMDNQ